MRRNTAVAVLVVVLVVGIIGLGAALQAGAQRSTPLSVEGVAGGVGDGARLAQARPVAMADRSADRDNDEIDGLLKAVRVGDAVSYKGLTLFPVSLNTDYGDFLPRTFDEAIESGELIVEEIGSGDVNSVRVRNRGRRPVFIMAGEIMSGSKQDRTAQRDVLIPTGEEWVSVPVYCVEAGRWTVVTPQFQTKRALANPSLRSQAYAGAGQGKIWAEVEGLARGAGVDQTANKALAEVYESDAVQDKLDDYMSALKLPRDRDVVGFVAFAGGREVGADLFGNPRVFEELREKLIRSYILAANGGPTRRINRPTSQDAARFLARAWSENCSRKPVSAPGIGESYRLHNRRHATGGSALVYRRECVHMSLFPDSARDAPSPVPGTGPGPVEVPRIQQSIQQEGPDGGQDLQSLQGRG